MNDIITLIPYSRRDSILSVSPETARKLGIANKKRMYVSFGIRKNYVDVSISEGLKLNDILLSQNVFSSLHIPDYSDYEICVRTNEIAIGPCIGILTGGSFEDVTSRRIKEVALNTLDYNSIHGAVIIFTLDKVNKEAQLIEGYCYNPKSNNWQKGIFPYPNSIYLRSILDEDWANHFLTAIGDRVFNNYNFGKWEMYEWFSKEPEIKQHLPYTKLYRHKRDIFDFLYRFKDVYVKPIWGMKGVGVVRVSMDGSNIVFRYREDDENKEITAESLMEAGKTMDELFKPNGHIVQQGLELIEYMDGVVDFRCVMQKDETSSWVCNGIVSRIGAKKSVVSNISSGGTALPAIDLLRDALSLSGAEAFAFKERMTSLCMKICRKLDEYGMNLGTLGLDLGIDRNKEIWLIEINNRRPHPAIALRVNDLPAYYTILSSPLHYAKALSGFEG